MKFFLSYWNLAFTPYCRQNLDINYSCFLQFSAGQWLLMYLDVLSSVPKKFQVASNAVMSLLATEAIMNTSSSFSSDVRWKNSVKHRFSVNLHSRAYGQKKTPWHWLIRVLEHIILQTPQFWHHGRAIIFMWQSIETKEPYLPHQASPTDLVFSMQKEQWTV